MAGTGPYVIPVEPWSFFRLNAFQIFVSPFYSTFSLLMITLNAFYLCLYTERGKEMSYEIVFLVYFVFEIVINYLALGVLGDRGFLDVLTVGLTFIFMFTGHNINLTGFRLLRIFKFDNNHLKLDR